MGRDGHQGWSREAEAGWERVFGPQPRRVSLEPFGTPEYFQIGEIIEETNTGTRWRVTPDFMLEEVERAWTTP